LEDVFQIPGFVNAHSHGFQRGLRGRAEGADFWAWRETMLELDGIARRQSGRRDVLGVDALLAIGSTEGAASLGLDAWPAIAVDGSHPQLRGVAEPLSALVPGCSADVVVGLA
jgi:cytosine/adenosine deaminase-related metal-dependent hydrolase